MEALFSKWDCILRAQLKKTKLGYKLSKQRTQLKIVSGTIPNFLFVQNCPLSLGIFKTVLGVFLCTCFISILSFLGNRFQIQSKCCILMRNILAWMSCLLVTLTVTRDISSVNLIWLNQWRQATSDEPSSCPFDLNQPPLLLTAEIVC